MNSVKGGKRKGSGRKIGPEGKAVPMAVTIPSELLQRLELAREAKGWTRSQAVAEAIRIFLDSIRENQLDT